MAALKGPRKYGSVSKFPNWRNGELSTIRDRFHDSSFCQNVLPTACQSIGLHLLGCPQPSSIGPCPSRYSTNLMTRIPRYSSSSISFRFSIRENLNGFSQSGRITFHRGTNVPFLTFLFKDWSRWSIITDDNNVRVIIKNNCKSTITYCHGAPSRRALAVPVDENYGRISVVEITPS